jgi:hypothetical protein
MKVLDAKLLAKFLQLASEKLKGRWLLVGGTLLPAVGIDVRSTVDIDLVGLGDTERLQNLELMELAEKLGLSIESINQAADYFVKNSKYHESDLIPLKRGKSAVIYRPSLQLYWQLKIARLTESDVADCLAYLGYCQGQGDKVSKKFLQEMIKREQRKESSLDKKTRLSNLSKALESSRRTEP